MGDFTPTSWDLIEGVVPAEEGPNSGGNASVQAASQEIAKATCRCITRVSVLTCLSSDMVSARQGESDKLSCIKS